MWFWVAGLVHHGRGQGSRLGQAGGVEVGSADCDWRAGVEDGFGPSGGEDSPRTGRAAVERAEVCKRADVAQLVEHSLGKGEVTSSILVISSRNSAISCSAFSFSCAVAIEPIVGLHEQERLKAERLELTAVLGGSNSVVESQPSKLLVASSILVSRSKSWKD